MEATIRGSILSESLPAKGEKLQLGDISQLTTDERTQKALKRLQSDKAPESVTQLVMWRLGQGLEWPQIAAMSSKWANAVAGFQTSCGRPSGMRSAVP